MAEHDEIFLGPGAKGDPYNPGPMQRGDVVALESVTEAVDVEEVPGQLFGADAHAAAADAPVPADDESDEYDTDHDDHEVT